MDVNRTLSDSECHMITREDEDLPERLKGLLREAKVKKLYYRGDLSLLRTPMVTVVGSRRYTSYGRAVTEMIGRTLVSNGITVVSGLATGIDSFAHCSALQHQGKTIAVLATGLGQCYPKSNKGLMERIGSDGLLLTEYEYDQEARKYAFPARNRILAALSDAVIVVEATIQSGSLITAGMAAEMGKTVFAVPGNITSSYSVGTNLLIKDGAVPLFSMNDILMTLGISSKDEEASLQLGEDEKPVYSLIQMNEGCTADQLVHELRKPIGTVQAILTILEMKGYIMTFAGKIYLAK